MLLEQSKYYLVLKPNQGFCRVHSTCSLIGQQLAPVCIYEHKTKAKSFVQCILVNNSLPYQSYQSTETAPTLINVLPTPPDARGTNLTPNIASMYVRFLIFPPTSLCVSIRIFACVGASIDSHFRYIRVGLPLFAVVCQSPSLLEPVWSPIAVYSLTARPQERPTR